MEIQIKKAVKAGNSSAVILPRAWLNKEVRIELVKKTPEVILTDSLEILRKHIPLKSVIGIYLVGSYARGEENEGSDIDLMVITDDIDREIISEGVYNILIVSYQLIHQKLKENLFPVGQMIREAVPLLNEDYIKDIDVKVTKKNVKWYLDSTKEKLKTITDEIENAKKIKGKKYVSDRIAYTLVLRIRTLEIIKKILHNKKYSKREFVSLIRKVSGSDSAYEGYAAIKDNLEDESRIRIDEAERLCDYLEDDLRKVSGMLK